MPTIANANSRHCTAVSPAASPPASPTHHGQREQPPLPSRQARSLPSASDHHRAQRSLGVRQHRLAYRAPLAQMQGVAGGRERGAEAAPRLGARRPSRLPLLFMVLVLLLLLLMGRGGRGSRGTFILCFIGEPPRVRERGGLFHRVFIVACGGRGIQFCSVPEVWALKFP